MSRRARLLHATPLEERQLSASGLSNPRINLTLGGRTAADKDGSRYRRNSAGAMPRCGARSPYGVLAAAKM